MVEIGRLLEINARYPHEHAFVHCLGDQYLYARNPLYRAIREAALDRGASYGEAGSELWHDYTVCPLFCLDLMLREGFIPLIDNESSLRRLAARSKSSFAVTGKFLTKVVKRNYLFHESCHYIAHCVSQEGAYHAGQDISAEGEHKVVVAFLGEAFATLAERIAWAMAQELTHILFFNLNSYVDHNVNEHKLLSECIPGIGLERLCHFGMLALFINNLRKRPLNEEELAAFLRYCFTEEDPKPLVENFTSLVRKVFSIAPAFLEETTPAYFRMVGLEKEFLALSSREHSIEQLAALMDGPMKSKLIQIITSAIPNASRSEFTAGKPFCAGSTAA